ncbi:MAG: long-chain fatty acid--CoA ligase [Desulfobacter sp.]|nr:MAG: long-chain fatty acid--CoA ligase [Desulfobacter sp.]
MSQHGNYHTHPWYKAYDAKMVKTIQYTQTLIPDFLDRAALEYPNQVALIFQGYTITFQELNRLTDRFAAVLQDFGISSGDRVAILLPNTVPCVVAYYATLRIGAVAVMNNPLYSNRELEYQFNDSGAKLLVTMDLLAERMVQLRKKTRIRVIIHTSMGDFLPLAKRLLFPLVAKKRGLSATLPLADNLFQFKEVLKAARKTGKRPAIAMDDLAMVQYTGGTTGIPKGVMLTHRNLSCQIQQLESWFPNFVRGEGTLLGALPFFHVFGLSTSMNFAIYMAWTNVLVPKPQPRQLFDAIEKFKPSFAPLVPTMFIGMLNHPEMETRDLSSLEESFSGSSPLPVEIINTFQKRTGSIIIEGYGLSESSPVTHINPFKGKRKPGSIGLPLPDVSCRIVDTEDGITPMPVGKPGELMIKGPQVMKGYLNRQEETCKTLTRDGWLHTGDIAFMDEDGYFFIVDRIKDMIISGGYNVYPREIEEVLYGHPKVAEACCVGIPHPKRGEAIKVFLQLKQGEIVTQEEIIEFCSKKLAKYKWPIEVEIRDTLPKSTVGKILKKDLIDA